MTDSRCAFQIKYPYPHGDLDGGCQFDDETELFPCGDSLYCRYHLPLADEQDEPTEKAAWADADSEAGAAFRREIARRIAAALDNGDKLNLSGVVFPGDMGFRETAMPPSLWYRARFLGRADFRKATLRDAIFQDAEFSGYADFSFSDRREERQGASKGETAPPASSSEATTPTANGGSARSRQGTFQILSFAAARIAGVADFSNRRFKERTSFASCRFGRAPEFHNAELHQDTDWDGAAFVERSGGRAQRAYRTLRLAMENNRDRSQEAVFFALEQETMRKGLPWWHANRWVSACYQGLSNYGRSLLRPTLWLLGSLLVFFLAYWVIDGQQVMGGKRFAALVGFTMQQLVKPFAVWGRVATDLSPLFPFPEETKAAVIPLGFKLLATLQSLLNLTFVALLILALRWLFKRG